MNHAKILTSTLEYINVEGGYIPLRHQYCEKAGLCSNLFVSVTFCGNVYFSYIIWERVVCFKHNRYYFLPEHLFLSCSTYLIVLHNGEKKIWEKNSVSCFAIINVIQILHRIAQKIKHLILRVWSELVFDKFGGK